MGNQINDFFFVDVLIFSTTFCVLLFDVGIIGRGLQPRGQQCEVGRLPTGVPCFYFYFLNFIHKIKLEDKG